MSRRAGGRFGGNSSEAYQRQLSAPVHKWKKAWISPTGLQPESSYKICKWVRVDTTAEDGSPAPDEDEDMEEGEDGDEGEAEAEAEGEAEGEADGEDVVVDAEAPGGGATISAEGVVTASTAAVPAPVDVPAPSEPAAVPAPADVAAIPSSVGGAGAVISLDSPVDTFAADSIPAAAQSDALPASDATSSSQPPMLEDPTPVATETTPHEATLPISHPIPANAIEIHNTARHTTEMGAGDLAGVGGVEMVHGEAAASADVGAEGTGMEVDQAQAGGDEGAAEVADVEAGQAPEVDDGLVMGDNEPERKEFEIVGEDKPREVDA